MGASLWDTVSVGGVKLRNRAVMPAMGTAYGSPRGEVTERLEAYHRIRAEAGVGLIVTEVCAVHPSGRAFPSELGIYDDSFLRGLAELAMTIRKAGAAAAVQLHHAGRETFPSVIGEQPVAPSPVASRAMGQVPRELSAEEVAELVRCYASAARRAREAGFDAVEVHGAHGYLVNQFLSPYSNHREDAYGGDDAGRYRFAREIVQAIKGEAGGDFTVIFRFSASEEAKGGYDLDYILPLLPLLQEDGVDAFHVSCGIYDSPGNPTSPGLHHPPGINVERAARVKVMVDRPVIVAGKIHDPRMAEEVLQAGKADLVAFGRQHLADPRFLAKAARGRYEDIRFCLSCNQGCIERLTFDLKSTTCVINPLCGREEGERKGEEASRGPFLVAGAGPAGLQAAITLAEAGAEVRIYEKDGEAGGQLRPASRPPGKDPYAEWVEWALRRLESLGVRVECGVEVGAELLREGGWRGVVNACGASPLLPQVKGSELDTNREAREVLLGVAGVGKSALVVGAGPVGMETAHYLISAGRKVTVVEEKEMPPVMPLTSHGYFLHRVLRESGTLLLGTRVVEVTTGGAVVEAKGDTRNIEADAVIWAVGSVSRRELEEAAREAGLAVVAVGDAVEPRRLLDAVHEGYKAAVGFLYGEEETG
ncbi:MAG: NAD(P)/FAD-dependent oxidoreductase [Actinomycetota bacterium]|nr:NAD(P)/FAD-dependent oxidoreductase [Actinomycetota bacterium]MDD5666014.1 NAD(P)/FAD-dependent oxidoreductase [Actinomycetota bacterium]